MKYVPADDSSYFIKSMTKTPTEVAMFEVSSSISYVEDRDVLGTKLGCNKKDWVEETGKKQDGGCS